MEAEREGRKNIPDRKRGCSGVGKKVGIRKGAGVGKRSNKRIGKRHWGGETAPPLSGDSERFWEGRGEWSALQSVGLINQSSKL
jgi:hypothetical protein